MPRRFLHLTLTQMIPNWNLKKDFFSSSKQLSKQPVGDGSETRFFQRPIDFCHRKADLSNVCTDTPKHTR